MAFTWQQAKQRFIESRQAGVSVLLFVVFLSMYWVTVYFDDPVRKHEHLQINHFALTLEDRDHAWRIEDVLSPQLQQQFQEASPGLKQPGYTRSVYWVKVVIPPRILKTIKRQKKIPRWYLFYARMYMDLAELYVVDPQRKTDDGLPLVVSHQSSDIRTTLDNRPVRHGYSVFEVDAAQIGSHDLYLKLRNDKAMFGELVLATPGSFFQQITLESGFMGIFVGGILLIICYNVNAYIATRAVVYLQFLGFIVPLSVLLLIEFWLPFSLQQATYEWITRSLPFLLWSAWILGVFYCRSHLETSKIMPFYDGLLLFSAVVGVICMLITTLVDFHTAILFTLVFCNLYLGLLFLVGYLAVRAGKRAGYEFCLGWLVNALGLGVTSAVALGWVEPSSATVGAGPGGVLLQGFIFSLSLSNRLEEATQQVAQERLKSLALSKRYSRSLEVKVEERTRDLQLKTLELGRVFSEKKSALELTSRYLEKVSELINNADEGFLSFGPDLVVEEGYSMECLRIFGGTSLEGKVPALLAQADQTKQQFLERALGALVNETDNPDTVELYIGLLPKEYRIGRGFYKATYKPLKNKVMLTLKDVTEEKMTIRRVEQERLALEYVVYALDQRQEVLQLIDDFRQFLTAAPEMILDAADIKETGRELNRAVHTFKSLFAQASAPHLPEALHEFESHLQKTMDHLSGSLELLKFFRQASLDLPFQADVDVLTAKLGADYLQKDATLKVETALVDALLTALAHQNGTDSALYSLALDLKRTLLRTFLEPHLKMAEKQAEKQEKSLSTQLLDPQNIRVDGEIYAELLQSMVHVFRNVVDHGVESPDERVEMDKPESAMLRVSLARDADSLLVTVEDDGRGIDVVALRKKLVSTKRMSLEEAQAAPDEVIYRSIFLDGVTSRKTVTLTAGRGVGLSAVKAEMDKLGGSIEVFSVPGQFTRFVFRLSLTP